MKTLILFVFCIFFSSQIVAIDNDIRPFPSTENAEISILPNTVFWDTSETGIYKLEVEINFFFGTVTFTLDCEGSLGWNDVIIPGSTSVLSDLLDGAYGTGDLKCELAGLIVPADDPGSATTVYSYGEMVANIENLRNMEPGTLNEITVEDSNQFWLDGNSYRVKSKTYDIIRNGDDVDIHFEIEEVGN